MQYVYLTRWRNFHTPSCHPLQISLGWGNGIFGVSNLGRRKLNVEATPSHKQPHFGQVTNLCTVAIGGLLGLRGKRVDFVFRLMGRKRKNVYRHRIMEESKTRERLWKRLEVVRRVQTLWRPWARESGACADIWATFFYVNKDVRKNGNAWCSRMKRLRLFF